MEENEIGSVIVDCAVKVHQTMGPGLLESLCEAVLSRHLEQRGFAVQHQVSLPFCVDGMQFEEGFRLDLLVEAKVIIELKSIENLKPVHKKQLLTYLKPSGLKLGFLLNFGDELMKSGIVRIINGSLQPSLRELRALVRDIRENKPSQPI